MYNLPNEVGSSNRSSLNKARANRRNRQRRRRKLKQNFIHTATTNNEKKTTAPSSAMFTDIWKKAYDDAVRWHSEHQLNYWRQKAMNLKLENEQLRQQLTEMQSMQSIPQYETSDEDSADENAEDTTEIDQGYLDFLKITYRHREELRQKRAAEAMENEMANEDKSSEINEASVVADDETK